MLLLHLRARFDLRKYNMARDQAYKDLVYDPLGFHKS